MAQFESLLWERIPRRVDRTRVERSEWRQLTDERAEWTAPPPGSLGRSLVEEIEAYLEFFAIARAADEL